MASVAATLLRLRWRARSRGSAGRIFSGAMLAAGLLAAYVLGQGLSVHLAAGEPAHAQRLVASLLLLVAGFASFAGAFLSTLSLLLREAHAEDEHLAALPLTFRDLAASRLAVLTARAVCGTGLLMLVGLAGALGVWGSGFIASAGKVQLAVWSMATVVSLLVEVLVFVAIGTLSALAFGWLVPPHRRELALIAAALGTALAAVLATLRLGPLLATATTAELGVWLGGPLAPVRAALRLQLAVQAGGLEGVVHTLGFCAAAAILLWLAMRVWARLLRYDLESAARPAHQHTPAAAIPVPRTRRGSRPFHESTLLERFFGGFPTPARAVLIRDLRQMGRSPAVRLRSGMLAISLLALAVTGFQPFWLLLLLYYAASELARDVLLRTLEEEGENLFFLQVVTPGLKGYLRMRALAGFLITAGASLILLTVATLLSPALTASIWALLARSILLMATAWLAVSTSLVCAALFVPDPESSGEQLALSPAELPVAVCGAGIALGCAVIDLRYLTPSDTVSALQIWLIIVVAAGLLATALAASPLALSVAARRMQRRSVG